jgi:hypothetical protein
MPHIQIQFRRDTSVTWTFANPVLASGEMGIELDTKQFKIGDGRTHWRDLPYGGIQGPPGPAGLILPSTTPISGQVLTYVGGSPSPIQWRNQLSYDTSTVIIRASMATGQNATGFDFSNPNWPTPVQSSFATGYTAGTQANPGGTNTDGFSLMLNPSYTMVNLPIITGTIAYWNNSSGKMFYMQMKFGNSSTSQSLSMTIEPTSAVNTLGNYGSPLKLQISGVTVNAFSGVGNIGTVAPLNYAIAIYLQLNN